MKWSAEAKVGLVTIVGVLIFTYVVITLAHAYLVNRAMKFTQCSATPMACKRAILSVM